LQASTTLWTSESVMIGLIGKLNTSR
jgi:hypothetical protein